MKILLIDDDAALGDILAALLVDLDAKVYQAPTCVEGRALLADGYDLVLMDYGLVGRDGLECIVEIRADHQEIPIVMLTGHCNEALADQVFAAGADDYVVKNEMSKLLEAVVWSAVKRRAATVRIARETAERQEALRRIGDVK